MPNEMVEAVAAAVAIESDVETKARASMAGYKPFITHHHRSIARAAIQALMEPNSAMLKAGNETKDVHTPTEYSYRKFQAMLRAALD